LLKNYGRWMVGWEFSDIGNKNLGKIGVLIDLNL
jgi:hypothetical protein